MPSRRAKSVLASVAAGCALGAVALVARYAPPPASTIEDTRARVVASSSSSSSAIASARSPSARKPSLELVDPADLEAREARELARDLDLDAGPRSLHVAEIPGPELERRARALAGASGPCPADMALVEGAFCGRLEHGCVGDPDDDPAHRCGEFRRGAKCRVKLDERRYCIDRFEWPNRFGEAPRVWVDWYEANKLCAEAGKRLCRRSEWMLACEGPKRLPYPWGFVRQPSPCNVDRAAIPFDEASMFERGDRARDDELARLYQADRIGSHPDCVSAYGVFDMAGNVDEWTDEGADDATTSNPAALHGGYWGPVRDTCRLATRSHGPDFKFYQVGFRCCADAPGTTLPPPRPFVESRDEKKK